MSNFLLAFILGYVFGCFQTSYFLSKKFINKDIRKMGSGNAGASNVTSEMGLKFGIITAILDILKAYLPVKLILIIFPTASQQIELMVIAGTAAILGHIFPFFMNFKGGKGIASYLGVLLGIDLQLGGMIFILLCLVIIITNYVAIGSIFLYLLIPILIFYYEYYSIIVIVCSLILLLIGILKHITNIKRIMNGSELSLRSAFNKNR
tara:strand:+ start:610 stop:1230 length:621 start_codon:yes stop_codon:yes gene_type:complete